MNTSYKAHPDRTPRSHKRYLLVSITLALTSLLASVQFANAAPITFTNAAGGNWSVGANWNPAGPPASSSDVVFGDGAGNSTTTEDILSATINSMTYNQDNGSQQTTIIPSGQTLTIASGVAAE